jgi:beta-galactosidase
VPSTPFLHGGDYNPDQWRHQKEIWQEDMRLAHLAHCNTFSVGIFAWSALEPEEGIFDFTGWTRLWICSRPTALSPFWPRRLEPDPPG